jgi:hypothetical protein
MKNSKYIALGILVGYLGLYVYELTQTKKNTFDWNSQEETNEAFLS